MMLGVSRRRPGMWLIVSMVGITACSSGPRVQPGVSTPTTVAALGQDGLGAPRQLSRDGLETYRLQPADVISVIVYREPDMSLSSVAIGPEGNISVPLLGHLPAAGRTTEELRQAVSEGLGARFLVDPRVAVNIVSFGSHQVTVEGAVQQPGVFEFKPSATLLSAVALAQGPTRVAKLNQVAIFRNVEGERRVAVFDLRAVRAGQMVDPELRPGDRVVVGFSGLAQTWQDVLQALPAAAIFTRF